MKKTGLTPAAPKGTQFPSLPTEREGTFKEGKDKLGRRYEKKLDSNGLYTKKEILKDGTPKLTIKPMDPKKKI